MVTTEAREGAVIFAVEKTAFVTLKR